MQPGSERDCPPPKKYARLSLKCRKKCDVHHIIQSLAQEKTIYQLEFVSLKGPGSFSLKGPGSFCPFLSLGQLFSIPGGAHRHRRPRSSASQECLALDHGCKACRTGIRLGRPRANRVWSKKRRRPCGVAAERGHGAEQLAGAHKQHVTGKK